MLGTHTPLASGFLHGVQQMIARKKTKCVVYYRCSTDKQDKSIQSQRSEVEAFAAENGYEILREYVDEDESGDDETRSEFLRLVGEFNKLADFEEVLCWHRDRFSRFDPINFMYYIKPMRDAKIRLRSVVQGLIKWESVADIIISVVESHADKKRVIDTARDSLRTLSEVAKQGKVTGIAAFGFKLVGDEKGEREIVKDDVSAALVDEAMDKMLAGWSMVGLVRHFNERGEPTPRGGEKWEVNTLRYILTNPIYMGRKIFGKVPSGKRFRCIGGEVVEIEEGLPKQQQSEQDCIVVEGAIPAIVTEAKFQAVQQILADRSKKRGPAHKYALSGLVRCGTCGGSCTGYSCADGVKRYFYYVCSAGIRLERKESPKCSCRVRRDHLEAIVLEHLREEFLSEERIAERTDDLRAYLRSKRDSQATQEARVERLYSDAEAEVKRLERKFIDADADVQSLIVDALRQARIERDRFKFQRDTEVRMGKVTEDALSHAMSGIVERLRAARNDVMSADIEVQRAAFNLLVESITIHMEKPGAGRKGRLTHVSINYRTDTLCAIDKHHLLTVNCTELPGYDERDYCYTVYLAA